MERKIRINGHSHLLPYPEEIPSLERLSLCETEPAKKQRIADAVIVKQGEDWRFHTMHFSHLLGASE